METAGCMDLPYSEYRISIFLREKDSENEWQRAGVELPQHMLELQKKGRAVTTFYGDMGGTESPTDLIIRVWLFLNHLCQEHAGQRVVVVCHYHVIKAFRILLTNVDPTMYAQEWKRSLPNC